MARSFVSDLLVFSALLVLLDISAIAGGKEGMAALDKGDYATAYKEFLPLAEKGDLTAAIQMGLFYHQGQGVKQDYSKAMDWYLKAFKGRKGDAFNNIGVMYRDGLGVEKNLEIAYALFWITYWGALGSEETQIRNGMNMNKIVAIMPPKQVEDAVKMNVEYVLAFVENRGKLNDKEQSLKYSGAGHPLKAMAELKESSEPGQSHHLTFELRAPKKLELDPDTKIELVTDESASSTPLNRIKKRMETEYIVLNDSWLISPASRYALMIKPKSGRASVFKLPLPEQPKPTGWTAWKKPDYLEKSDAMWTFMHDLKEHDRSTTIPADCFELRYKIERQE